jgi:uncharacterized protein YjbI with pentapeptide repeats
MVEVPDFYMRNHREQISQSQIQLLDRFLKTARDKKVIEPGGILEGNPVCLRGLAFPTVEECALLGIPEIDAKRLVGQQRIEGALLRKVDFSLAKLDFSVWSKCVFREVVFSRTSLQNCRFFGCEFTECSFQATDFSNCSFGIETDGSESSFQGCLFERALLRGVSWCRPSFTEVTFIGCRITKSEFDEPSFRASCFVGNYRELTFRGSPQKSERNLLDIDLTGAEVVWLHANHGVDLTGLRLSPHGTSLVIRNRDIAVPVLTRRLAAERKEAQAIAYMLDNIFTNKSISPLSPCQQTVFISAKLIQELDENLTKDQAVSLLQAIRKIAVEEGFTG